MDYKELLKKYMLLVAESEGVTLVRYAETPDFTLEEINELIEIDKSLEGV